jgi:hypothetical protein
VVLVSSAMARISSKALSMIACVVRANLLFPF